MSESSFIPTHGHSQFINGRNPVHQLQAPGSFLPRTKIGVRPMAFCVFLGPESWVEYANQADNILQLSQPRRGRYKYRSKEAFINSLILFCIVFIGLFCP